MSARRTHSIPGERKSRSTRAGIAKKVKRVQAKLDQRSSLIGSRSLKMHSRGSIRNEHESELLSERERERERRTKAEARDSCATKGASELKLRLEASKRQQKREQKEQSLRAAQRRKRSDERQKKRKRKARSDCIDILQRRHSSTGATPGSRP